MHQPSVRGIQVVPREAFPTYDESLGLADMLRPAVDHRRDDAVRGITRVLRSGGFDLTAAEVASVIRGDALPVPPAPFVHAAARYLGFPRQREAALELVAERDVAAVTSHVYDLTGWKVPGEDPESLYVETPDDVVQPPELDDTISFDTLAEAERQHERQRS